MDRKMGLKTDRKLMELGVSPYKLEVQGPGASDTPPCLFLSA